jgi:hypothetical protein
MDDLTNAWIADPGSPIFVNGNIFSHPGTYKIILEVTTIDNDKTGLAQPLTYEYNIQVSPYIQVIIIATVNTTVVATANLSDPRFQPGEFELLI